MEAVIAHTDRVEPEVNGFMATFHEQALEAARTSEDRWQGIGEPPRPLEGVPVAVSDELEIKGQPLTESTVQLIDHKVETTEPLANRIYDSGAAVHARTATSEYLYSPYMHSELYGTTANPWNPEYNASGCGGGASAALAAGTTMLAGGIDSLAVNTSPSACGVVGFKPSYGRIPLVPPFALDTLAHYSPMARTVEDCALFFDQLSGLHSCDPASLPDMAAVGQLHPDPSRLKIAWSEDLGGYEVDADVRRNTRSAMKSLRDAGASVDEVELQFDPAEIGDATLARLGHALLPILKRQFAAEGKLAPHSEALMRRAVEQAGRIALLDAFTLENRIYSELAQVFTSYDAFVCPALAIPAFALEPDESDFTRVLTGAAFNMCGRHPYVSVPSGRSSDGVPTAVLVVGPRYADGEVLLAAASVEAVVQYHLAAGPAFGHVLDRL